MRYRQVKKNSPRNVSLVLDWVHIVIGALVSAMAAAAFINPDRNRILFPLIFFLGAMLNVFNGIYRYQQSGRNKRKKASAVGLLLIAGFLMAVMAVSAISIWRQG